MNTSRPRSRHRVTVDAPAAFVVEVPAERRPPTADVKRRRRRGLRQLLDTHEARRQAFLLRELISPPVALRDHTGDRPD